MAGETPNVLPPESENKWFLAVRNYSCLVCASKHWIGAVPLVTRIAANWQPLPNRDYGYSTTTYTGEDAISEKRMVGQTQPHNCYLTFSIVFVPIDSIVRSQSDSARRRYRTLRAHTNANTVDRPLFDFTFATANTRLFICLYDFVHNNLTAQQIIHRIPDFENSFALYLFLFFFSFSLFIFADVVWHRRIASNRFQWLHSQRTKLNSLRRMATNCAQKLGSAYGILSACTRKITGNWWSINTNERGKREMRNRNFFHIHFTISLISLMSHV